MVLATYVFGQGCWARGILGLGLFYRCMEVELSYLVISYDLNQKPCPPNISLRWTEGWSQFATCKSPLVTQDHAGTIANVKTLSKIDIPTGPFHSICDSRQEFRLMSLPQVGTGYKKDAHCSKKYFKNCCNSYPSHGGRNQSWCCRTVVTDRTDVTYRHFFSWWMIFSPPFFLSIHQKYIYFTYLRCTLYA